MIGDGDLELIFESGDFDTSAIFATVPDTEVRGWFTGGSDQTLLFGQVSIEAQTPSFICETADLTSSILPKLSVTIDSVTYTVERIEKVGTGVSVVYLKT